MAISTKFWTRLQLWEKFKDENDIDDEDDFVDKDEATSWMNDAIDAAEALIHLNYEDYFLKPGYVTMVSGTDTSALPTDIYAHKIRAMIYTSGSKIYPITHLHTLDKFLQYRLSRQNASSDDYCYFIVNTVAGAPVIKWSPVPTESSTTNIEIWYYRQANSLVDDADKCDIPEFASFISAWLDERLEAKKRNGSPAHARTQERLEAIRKQMVDTLQDMIVDGDDVIASDTSHYEEHQ